MMGDAGQSMDGVVVSRWGVGFQIAAAFADELENRWVGDMRPFDGEAGNYKILIMMVASPRDC
jgi:hypothetical protein